MAVQKIKTWSKMRGARCKETTAFLNEKGPSKRTMGPGHSDSKMKYDDVQKMKQENEDGNFIGSDWVPRK